MTERPQDDARLPHDPTRDITLPPLRDRPPSAMPRQWADWRPTAEETPDFSSPPPPLPEHDEADAAEPGLESIVAEQATDQLDPPPRPRERTLAFSSPEMGRRPVGPVKVAASRRWPWVVLTLLPVLVIVGAGVAWLVLIRTM